MLTIGADPEFFLKKHDSTSDKVVPVCGLIGGTKKKPLPLKQKDGTIAEGYGVQEDNIMLEFNVPPADGPNAFAHSIVYALKQLEKQYLTPNKVAPRHGAAVQVPLRDLKSPQAKEFGCSPDYDAYKDGLPCKRVNPKALEDAKTKTAWRFAGGHVHIGHDLNLPPFVLANFCDVFLGLNAITQGEIQGERRKWYGQAGRFRPTSYGIEYRTLSNYWLWSADYSSSIAHYTQKMYNMLANANNVTRKKWFAEIPWVDVQTAINEEKMNLAHSLETYIWQEVFKVS